jgi:hypothetical protein
LDKFEQHPGLMEALFSGDDAVNFLISSHAAKVDKSTSTAEVGMEGQTDGVVVINPLLHGEPDIASGPGIHERQLQELTDTIEHLKKELQKKKTCCFGFC